MTNAAGLAACEAGTVVTTEYAHARMRRDRKSWIDAVVWVLLLSVPVIEPVTGWDLAGDVNDHRFPMS